MVTLDYSYQLLWGVRKDFQARLDKVEAWEPHTGFGNRPQQLRASEPINQLQMDLAT